VTTVIIVLLFFGLFSSIYALRPPDALEPKCEIYEYGIYEYTSDPVDGDNSVPNGYYNNFDESISLITQTKIIPAKIKTRMAYRFRIKNLPKKNFSIEIERRHRFPSFIDINGNEFSGYNDKGFYNSKNGVVQYIDGYSFDRKEELAIGTWTFELWHKSKFLCSISFEVQR
jgi:hypothetical protein